MKHVIRLAVIALVAYLGIASYLFFAQRGMQYRPDPSPMNPVSAGLAKATQSTLKTSDGETVVTWWIAPRDERQPVFLYLHGNGANLHARAARFARLTETGAGLMAVSWRGYGGSSGSPSEAGLRIDARATYDALVSERRIPPERIVLFGESLGTTVATILAAEVQSAALVLDSSFASALDVAQRAYPWLPVSWLLRDQYRADLAAPNVTVPVQQIHCEVDRITPIESANLLKTRFSRSEPIHIVDGACHVPNFSRYESFLRRFLNAKLSGASVN